MSEMTGTVMAGTDTECVEIIEITLRGMNEIINSLKGDLTMQGVIDDLQSAIDEGLKNSHVRRTGKVRVPKCDFWESIAEIAEEIKKFRHDRRTLGENILLSIGGHKSGGRR